MSLPALGDVRIGIIGLGYVGIPLGFISVDVSRLGNPIGTKSSTSGSGVREGASPTPTELAPL